MNPEVVDDLRLFKMNRASSFGDGDVVYLMSRENRIDDNWGLLYALQLSDELNRKVRIIHIIDAIQKHLSMRTLEFLIGGLKEVKQRASELGLAFRLMINEDPVQAVRRCCGGKIPAAVVCDFSPLRENLVVNNKLAVSLDVPVIEVDGHNIIPCRWLSGKQEYSANTLRKKIEAVLPHFLTDFPAIDRFAGKAGGSDDNRETDWQAVRSNVDADESVMKVRDIRPGYEAGMVRLSGFIENRLASYNDNRNDPVIDGQSGLSPYLHFGQISPQRAALSAARFIGGLPLKGGFLDEIIVRRELSDNFCLYNPEYDTFEGFPGWAKQSLNLHAADKREYLYSLEELDAGLTHDRLWNAAQKQMTATGIMHGYMRMYWAKKILEWSASGAEAMKRAVYLNDRYSLDGNDPNGYAGCAWSIGGVHDRAWADRSVFGKIRYMNEKGCKRKFDTGVYISRVEDMIQEIENGTA